MEDLLVVRDLEVNYHTPSGPVKAVNGCSFSLKPGERLGLVGESGSGKSTIALSLMRMIRPPGKTDGGEVILDGVDLLKLDDEEMRKTRLAKMSMVAQGAMNSLNPVKRVRDQFRYALEDHDVKLGKEELEVRVGDLLERVGLRRSVADLYPHELSGGMKQRVCIAIAICMSPKLIIADEPTSALDVVVQWQVIDTLHSVQQELGAAVIQIGHDMGLMTHSVDRIGVMYAGQIAEIGTVDDVINNPLHPYTQLLIASLPSLEHKEPLRGIPGLPPSLLNRDENNCPFTSRCPYAFETCTNTAVPLREMTPGHFVACHLYEEAGAGRRRPQLADIAEARAAEGAIAR